MLQLLQVLVEYVSEPSRKIRVQIFKKCRFSDFFSTSHSGGNQVDGSPPATSTAAVLDGLRLGSGRFMNLGGTICIVSDL